AFDHARHHPHHPAGALAAGGALAATLVLVEGGEPPDRLDDVGLPVHDDDRRGAKRRTDFLEAVEIHDGVAHVLAAHAGHRGAAGDHRQQIVPAAANAAAMLVDHLLEGDAERLLEG